MTICIAAACEEGKTIVAATDGRLSLGDVASDPLPAKMRWLDDWLVMYAGDPGQFKMVLEELYYVSKGEKLTRENIQQFFRTAYHRRRATPILAPFDITLEQFKSDGLRVFGDTEFSRLSGEISGLASDVGEQIIVAGWGKTEHAAMLYEISPWGDADHAIGGVATIGSGAGIAGTTLMLLSQSQHSHLPETLYAVAAAKFSAEKSKDGDVGQTTAIYVTWKRTGAYDKEKPSGLMLSGIEVAKLRYLWEQHGRPRVPNEVVSETGDIVQKITSLRPSRPDRGQS